MAEIETRIAKTEDWPAVQRFFLRNYRSGHPFQFEPFWRWQTEDPASAESYISLLAGEVVAHLGMNVGGGYVWVIQLLVEQQCRGKGVVRSLYDLARRRGPLATTNANAVALRMYRKMRWVRTVDLQRYVVVRPGCEIGEALSAVEMRRTFDAPKEGRYWRQPGIRGAQLTGGTAVLQPEIGGARLIDLDNVGEVLDEIWAAGFNWADFITSWADPLCEELEERGWFLNEASPIPWRLNPVVPGSVAKISVLSEKPLDPYLIIRRTYCDHGRVGSVA